MTSASMALIFGVVDAPKPQPVPKPPEAKRKPSVPTRQQNSTTGDTKPAVHKLEGVVMCVAYEISAESLQEDTIKEVINRVFEITKNTFSPQKYHNTSEVAAINMMRANEYLKPSKEMCELLRTITTLNKDTLGVFDPTADTVLSEWEQAIDNVDNLPAVEELKNKISKKTAAAEKISWGRLFSFNETRQTLMKHVSRGTIDVSGVAKGWAVDTIFNKLKLKGGKNIYVNWGGDMRCSGPHQWSIPVMEPPPLQEMFSMWRTHSLSSITSTSDEPAYTFSGSSMAIATSGDYGSAWKYGFFPVLNPVTDISTPMQAKGGSIASVTVNAYTCAAADAWATTLLSFHCVSNLEKWLRKLEPVLNESVVTICVLTRDDPPKRHIYEYGKNGTNVKIRDFSRHIPHQVALLSNGGNEKPKYVFALDTVHEVGEYCIFCVEKTSAMAKLTFLNETFRVSFVEGTPSGRDIAMHVASSPLPTDEVSASCFSKETCFQIELVEKIDAGDRDICVAKKSSTTAANIKIKKTCLVTGSEGGKRFYKKIPDSLYCIPLVCVSKDGLWVPGMHFNVCSVMPPALSFVVYKGMPEKAAAAILKQGITLAVSSLLLSDFTSLRKALEGAATLIPTAQEDRLTCTVTRLRTFATGTLVVASVTAMTAPSDPKLPLLISSNIQPAILTPAVL
eukprot:TRINITY_DN4628_c1_g1_i1.p1 TRINITY_DN4628_c1_g1~~TRINITY_DN4628_c1_g1_i1.p1  ORF type:complete len:695 (+),score=129.06 TRINITY_DN4628_c1_g1_i1:55-2085(+)